MIEQQTLQDTFKYHYGGKIDQIEDQQFYTLSNCLLKHFYEKKLSTTEDTIIKIAEKQETVKQSLEKETKHYRQKTLLMYQSHNQLGKNPILIWGQFIIQYIGKNIKTTHNVL